MLSHSCALINAIILQVQNERYAREWQHIRVQDRNPSVGICTLASNDHGFEECAVVQEVRKQPEEFVVSWTTERNHSSR